METGIFAEQVGARVEMGLGSSHRVSIHKVNKNNGVIHTGLRISADGSDISPVIYIDRYLSENEKGGMTMEGIAGHVMDVYKKERGTGMMVVDKNKFLSYDNVRENVVYKLVNTEKNRELLEDVPHIGFMDMSIVFQCMLQQDEVGTASILIHNVHLRLWDVTKEELYRAAEENTQKLMPYEIRSMAEVLREIMDDYEGEMGQYSDGVPMYVLSNRNKVEGATCMLYPDLLRDFSDREGSSFYIIPSSIHELLLLPVEDDSDSAEIKGMIKEVNDTHVSEEEILSYLL